MLINSDVDVGADADVDVGGRGYIVRIISPTSLVSLAELNIRRRPAIILAASSSASTIIPNFCSYSWPFDVIFSLAAWTRPAAYYCRL